MALSSRLAVSGQISVIIWLDIWYYPAGYLVLSSRISGIIQPDIRYYLAGYPNPALKKLQDIRYPAIQFCFNQQDIRYPAKSLSGTSLIFSYFLPWEYRRCDDAFKTLKEVHYITPVTSDQSFLKLDGVCKLEFLTLYS